MPPCIPTPRRPFPRREDAPTRSCADSSPTPRRLPPPTRHGPSAADASQVQNRGGNCNQRLRIGFCLDAKGNGDKVYVWKIDVMHPCLRCIARRPTAGTTSRMENSLLDGKFTPRPSTFAKA